MPETTITIHAQANRADAFWRAGIRFPGVEEVRLGEDNGENPCEITVTPRQLAVLMDEPMLTITNQDGSAIDPAQYSGAALADEPAAPADERDAAIRAVIAGLDPADPAQFTTGGKPQVDAINSNLPEGMTPVTAAERDAVWAAMQVSG